MKTFKSNETNSIRKFFGDVLPHSRSASKWPRVAQCTLSLTYHTFYDYVVCRNVRGLQKIRRIFIGILKRTHVGYMYFIHYRFILLRKMSFALLRSPHRVFIPAISFNSALGFASILVFSSSAYRLMPTELQRENAVSACMHQTAALVVAATKKGEYIKRKIL